MKTLTNALSRLIDNSGRCALSILDDAQKAFNNFDLNTTIDSIMESSRNAFNGFNDFMKTVKDSVSDFKVIVPFNENKEKYDIKVENGVITVTINGKNSRRETTATIPSNCILDKMERFVDKKKGNLVIVIPKNVAEDENIKKFKETVSTKVNTTASWIKEALKDRAESVAKSTTAPTSKPKMPNKNKVIKPKIARGKNGKFVSSKKQ